MEDSFYAKLQPILSKYDASPAAYHGGSFTYRDCQNLLAEADDFFDDVEALVLSSWSEDQALMPKEEFLAALDRFRLLFTLLDKIWSSVRGHEEGLLPTEEQLDRLQATITATKRVWLEVGLEVTRG